MHLIRVATWNTNLRYDTVLRSQGDANKFVQSVVALVNWAEGRMRHEHQVQDQTTGFHNEADRQVAKAL